MALCLFVFVFGTHTHTHTSTIHVQNNDGTREGKIVHIDRGNVAAAVAYAPSQLQFNFLLINVFAGDLWSHNSVVDENVYFYAILYGLPLAI